jgi:hypothetical protein
MTTMPQWQISNGTERGFLSRIAGRYCRYRNQIKHLAGAPKSSHSTERRRRYRTPSLPSRSFTLSTGPSSPLK